MAVELDDKRKEILAADGHLIIEGGPGCGKTTIALLKGQKHIADLAAEQRILFLSFSRAAVRQVTDRMAGVLSRADREVIEVRTFHAFFLDVIRSHGRLLTGKPVSFITPEREAQRRAEHDGDWSQEAIRLAREESVFVFDTLAATAADLIEGSADVRALLSDRYPLIIVDEFQDTSRDQWRVIQALAATSTVICLADPDQRIFDYLDGVDEHRLQDALEALSPATFDLSADNHRSPNSGMLGYANAVLRGTPASRPSDIAAWSYQYPTSPELRVHQAVIALRRALIQGLGGDPTIAVLTRTNPLAARVSEALAQEERLVDGEVLPAVEHALSWDPELTAMSALVIASVLEWPLKAPEVSVLDTLQAVTAYYRTKLGQGTRGARATLATLQRAIDAILQGRRVASKCAQVLFERVRVPLRFRGDPVTDWQTARSLLAGAAELDEIRRQARLIRLLRSTDVLAWALADAWDGEVGYRNAADVVRVALAGEAVNAAQQDPLPVSVMTMHKSKGKEFDGVVLVEGQHQGQFFSEDPARHDADRRLLRVAITRARHAVVLVRPGGVPPLVPPA